MCKVSKGFDPYANMWSGCAYFFIISASGVRYRWWSALALMLQMDVVGSALLVKQDHLFGREVFFPSPS